MIDLPVNVREIVGAAGGLAGVGEAGKISPMPTAADVGAPDWEAGTWTPTIHGYSPQNAGTLATAEGWYCRTGKLVKIAATIKLSSKGTIPSNDRLYIGGLPFSPAHYDTTTTTYFKGAVDIASVMGEITPGGTIGLYTPTVGKGAQITNLTAGNVTDNFELTEISATYLVN